LPVVTGATRARHRLYDDPYASRAGARTIATVPRFGSAADGALAGPRDQASGPYRRRWYDALP